MVFDLVKFNKKQVGENMKSILIKLDVAESVKNFVAIVEKYPFEIDLRCGRHVVNAKSVLGILSLDLNSPVVVEVYTDDCQDLVVELAPFIV